MILGIGTDIIEIDRIKKAIENKGFLDKIYTKNEQKLFENKPPQTFAGNFSAKEAVAKAFGVGFRGFYPCDIEILRDNLGKPFVNLYGEALTVFKKLGGKNIHITISHCKTYATAYALIED